MKKTILTLSFVLTVFSGVSHAQFVTWADFYDSVTSGPVAPGWTGALNHSNIGLGSGSFDLRTTGGRNLAAVGTPNLWGSFSPTTLGLTNTNNFERFVQSNSLGTSTVATNDATTVTIENFAGVITQDLILGVGGLDNETTIRGYNGATLVELIFLGAETPPANATHDLDITYDQTSGFLDIPGWSAVTTRPGTASQSKMAFFSPTADITHFEVINRGTEPESGGAIVGVRDSYIFAVGLATAVPEPSSMALLGLGALGFIMRRKR